jgi:antitoxin (DNA-binding transcriptional repressor) of toxin-antitoxin stability system
VIGIERPWLWSLPTRVELAEDAVIQFEEHGQSGVQFSQAQIDRMFEIGLMQPSPTTERDPAAPAGVTLTGDAKFLVGQVDLGREVGLEVLVRGLEVAIDVSVRKFRDRQPHVETADVEDPVTTYEPDDDQPDEGREIQLPIDQAGDRMPELLADLERGARVVLVDRGVRVAALTTWSYYASLREKLSAASVAFWTAWRTGVFDVAGYATEMVTVLSRPGAKHQDHAPGAGDAAEDGDGDDDAE